MGVHRYTVKEYIKTARRTVRALTGLKMLNRDRGYKAA
jgi:hypothetical protein